VARLLHRLRAASPRRIGNAILLFFASLAVGKACELAFSAETLSAALRAQARGIEAVRSLTPLSLTTGYVSDLGAASVGDLIYRPPLVVVKPKLRHQNREEAARYGACHMALALAPTGSIPPQCAAIGVTDVAAFIARERALQTLQDTLAPVAAPMTTKRWKVPGVLIPLAAIVRTGTRVASKGVFASLLAVFQLAAGLLCVLVITKARSKTDTAGLGGVMSNLVLLPIAAVVVGSGLAWVTQAVMLGALQVFQWATGLAAAAAGASGLAGFCWYCVAKLGEKSVEGVVTGKG
jgi:hypothetical protein